MSKRTEFWDLIHFVLLDKTLAWGRVNLSGRFLTVGGAKTEGGEGRINLYEAFVQHRAACIEAGSGSRRNLLRRNLLRRHYILIQTEAEPKRKWGISAMTRHAKPRRRIGFV